MVDCFVSDGAVKPLLLSLGNVHSWDRRNIFCLILLLSTKIARSLSTPNTKTTGKLYSINDGRISKMKYGSVTAMISCRFWRTQRFPIRKRQQYVSHTHVISIHGCRLRSAG